MFHGPDPEQFRTKVYGARWYCDPLPACELAPETQDRWPAITTIKKAWSKPFRKTLPTGERVPLDAFWAAEFAVDKLEAIQALGEDRAAAITLVATSASRFLNSTANRGTGVHAVMEDLGAGKEINEVWLDAAVVPFLPACRSFIADWHPLWVATEFVALNRTIGFGGTADSIITIQREGRPWTALVDYKTRGGDHGCYEEDAAQIGGYSLAEYIIVKSPDTGLPTRIPMPTLDGGLLVSLTKDSYQLFPVDLDNAQEAFRAMRESWHQHREGQKAARKARKNILIATDVTGTGPVDTPVESAPATSDRLEWLRGRIEAIATAGHIDELALTWPAGVPTLKQGGLTDAHVDAISTACDDVERAHRMPFPYTDDPFQAFDQNPGVALEQAVTEARVPSPTAAEWKERILALLEPLGDEVVQKAVVEAAGATAQKATRQMHDRIAAVVAELNDPNGAIALEIAGDGAHAIVCTADARDRLAERHGNEIAALAVAKSHAKALGLPAPRSLKSVVEQPLLVALVAAGPQQ